MAVRTVFMEGFEFKDELSGSSTTVIQIGDNIKWTNKDTAEHNAERSDLPTFKTALLAQGLSSDPVTFTEATSADGIVYVCGPHSTFMTGRIIVTLPGSKLSLYARGLAVREHEHGKKK